MRSFTLDKPSTCDVTEDTIKDRRLKKRELDHKAQHLARERTKSRITHLEAMVTHLKQSDANSRVLSLTNHLSQATSDRDKLLNALESLTCLFAITSRMRREARKGSLPQRRSRIGQRQHDGAPMSQVQHSPWMFMSRQFQPLMLLYCLG
ncbi:hypothetical protein QQZ08_000510 [Neonectria magnoliae]|uniref:BHLH domain-containing protein n=1 Tax=Neonectria magnoliae TaxID=2732573 RepID=A0ABR1IKG4_9HYPO